MLLLDKYEDDFDRYSHESILQQPNIVKPLHGVNPRTIMGAANWRAFRRAKLVENNFEFFIDRSDLSKESHLHECYKVDTTSFTTECTNYIILRPLEHAFIHSGRSLTLAKRGSKEMTLEHLRHLVWDGLLLLRSADKVRIDPKTKKILVFKSIFDAVKLLDNDIKQLAYEYFVPYDLAVSKVRDLKESWGKWRLVYDGAEYKSNFKSYDAWYKHYKQLNNRGGIDDMIEKFDERYEYII